MTRLSKIALIIGFLSVAGILFYSSSKSPQITSFESDNIEAKPLEIKMGRHKDADCGMIINSLDYASQVIEKNGKTWFFHDHGGMVKWLETKEFKKEAVIWVWAKDAKKWIDGRKAWYSLKDITPMNYGFGAYLNKGSDFIDFEEMSLKMARGENLTNPYVAKQLGVAR